MQVDCQASVFKRVRFELTVMWQVLSQQRQHQQYSWAAQGLRHSCAMREALYYVVQMRFTQNKGLDTPG